MLDPRVVISLDLHSHRSARQIDEVSQSTGQQLWRSRAIVFEQGAREKGEMDAHRCPRSLDLQRSVTQVGPDIIGASITSTGVPFQNANRFNFELTHQGTSGIRCQTLTGRIGWLGVNEADVFQFLSSKGSPP